ncbi:FAD-binding protein [Cohnella thermotolerans]|uniref:FAD-binding protein n=1 Tax=Cohnella thermotolerans TaxID=329858 RepID=UPI0012EC3DEB|nr:FAD-binding protein [Cohnella thermotolerans]
MGGSLTDLSGRVLGSSGEAIPGLYAAERSPDSEAGGMHGRRRPPGTVFSCAGGTSCAWRSG